MKTAKDLEDKKKCNWGLADQYDLTALEGEMFRVTEVDEEVQKRLERKARSAKWPTQGLADPG